MPNYSFDNYLLTLYLMTENQRQGKEVRPQCEQRGLEEKKVTAGSSYADFVYFMIDWLLYLCFFLCYLLPAIRTCPLTQTSMQPMGSE